MVLGNALQGTPGLSTQSTGPQSSAAAVGAFPTNHPALARFREDAQRIGLPLIADWLECAQHHLRASSCPVHMPTVAASRGTAPANRNSARARRRPAERRSLAGD